MKKSESKTRTIWYQGQYAIAHRFGSPQAYQRGRIVMKRGENFYIKPFGEEESVAVHQSKVEFFTEDGKKQLTEAQIKDLLKMSNKRLSTNIHFLNINFNMYA